MTNEQIEAMQEGAELLRVAPALFAKPEWGGSFVKSKEAMWVESRDRVCIALDQLAAESKQEPSEDAKELLRRIDTECDAVNSNDGDETIGFIILDKAAGIIEADRERTKRECAGRACAMFRNQDDAFYKEIQTYMTHIDKNLRAEIMNEAAKHE